MGCLYQLQFPNGKSYLGITAHTAEKRFANHCGEAKLSTLPVHRAILKYGSHAVKVVTLVRAEDWQYLCELERRAIDAFGTFSAKGYNRTSGGDGASPGSAHHKGFKHSEESKCKMRFAALGRRHSGETKAKLRIVNKGNKYSAGRIQSNEERSKRSQALLCAKRDTKPPSGVTGVFWCPTNRRWKATIGNKTLGRFDTIDEASAVRSLAVAKALGSMNELR